MINVRISGLGYIRESDQSPPYEHLIDLIRNKKSLEVVYFEGVLQVDHLVIGIGNCLHHGFAHRGVRVNRF